MSSSKLKIKNFFIYDEKSFDHIIIIKKELYLIFENYFISHWIMSKNMRLKKYICASIVIMTLIVSSQEQTFSKTINVTAKSSAKLSFVQGKVYSLEKSKWIVLSKGNIIKINEQIRTDKKSKAEITFSDGSRVRLSENTNIVLVRERQKENEHGLLKIFSGKLWANIFNKSKNRFSVQSNTAALAVLGTTFNVEAENKETEVSVFEGSVGIQTPTEDNNQFNKKLDNLSLIIDDKKTTNIQKPDKIDKPVQEIEKPFKVIDGPHQVNQDEWLEIIANQKITIDDKGVGTVADIKAEEIKEDEWVQWNKELDSNTSENMLFSK